MRTVWFALVGALVVLAIFGWLGSRVVNQDEIALRYRWGVIDDMALNPGFHILWPGHSFVVFNNTKRHIEINQREEGESVKGIAVITSDHFIPGVIVNFEYNFFPEKALVLLSDYGRNDSQYTRNQIEKRIRNEIEMAVRGLLHQYTMDEIIAKRDEIRDQIKFMLDSSDAKLPQKLAENDISMPAKPEETVADVGIDISSFSISIDTPKNYSDLQDKLVQNKTEKAMATVLNAQIENETLREQLEQRATARKKVIAQGDSALAEASNIGRLIKQWDGELPNSIIMGEGDGSLFRELLKATLVFQGSEQKQQSAPSQEK